MKLIVLFFLISFIAQAKYLGELDTPNYYGPFTPKHIVNSENGEIIFADKQFFKSESEKIFGREIFWGRDFLETQIGPQFTCPDSYFNASSDYIRYLFRLVTISYVFEDLKQQYVLMYQANKDTENCSIEWNHLFAKCTPQTTDMKLFLKRLQNHYQSLSKIDQTQLVRRSSIVNPVSTCNEKVSLLQQVCSEEDLLFGISYSHEDKDLVRTSDAFIVIGSGGKESACLDRFISFYQKRERVLPFLKTLFANTMQRFKSQKKTYLQGEIFIPGALKEFDEKGLTDFIFTEKRPEVVAVAKIPVVIPVKKIERPRPVVKVEPPKPVIKERPVEKLVVPEVNISQFEQAVIKLQKEKLSVVSVKMDAMKDDFIFTEEIKSAMSGPLEEYQTRKGLLDMKTLDNLGSTEAPMSLMFLKYLIDTDSHHGLYNIIAILGDHFYVINDLENKTASVPIHLYYNKYWQIDVLAKLK